MIYNVDGLGGPLVTASNSEPLAVLWNPSSTRRVKVTAVSIFFRDYMSTALDWLWIRRTSTRGTPGSTITPDADNAGDGGSEPPSGALLDLGEFSALPTFLGVMHAPWVPFGATGGEGGGFFLPLPRGIILAPGRGLAIVQSVGEAMGGTWDASFEFED